MTTRDPRVTHRMAHLQTSVFARAKSTVFTPSVLPITKPMWASILQGPHARSLFFYLGISTLDTFTSSLVSRLLPVPYRTIENYEHARAVLLSPPTLHCVISSVSRYFQSSKPLFLPTHITEAAHLLIICCGCIASGPQHGLRSLRPWFEWAFTPIAGGIMLALNPRSQLVSSYLKAEAKTKRALGNVTNTPGAAASSEGQAIIRTPLRVPFMLILHWQAEKKKKVWKRKASKKVEVEESASRPSKMPKRTHDENVNVLFRCEIPGHGLCIDVIVAQYETIAVGPPKLLPDHAFQLNNVENKLPGTPPSASASHRRCSPRRLSRHQEGARAGRERQSHL
ncbi:hypothetical protein B0H11DRAFT_1906445 [Mycena galericulata]|nr:hypothetical protein B0H11DRAFT_1906445 [Mycena galericulata]